MRDFFSLDGSFSRYGTMIADALILSLMWLVFSAPIITAGAATSAMFYVSTRRIADREGYITSDFWSAFKTNFLKATGLWLIVLLVGALLSFNVWMMIADAMVNEDVSLFSGIVFMAQLIFLLQLSFITVFLFPLNARFEMGVLQTIKNAFFMANRHMLTSFLCTLLVFGLIFGGLMTGGLLLVFAPGIYALLASYMLMKIFKRYRPEMDKDPRLEIAEFEAERDAKRREED